MNEENNPTMNGEKTYDERKTIRNGKKKLSETKKKNYQKRVEKHSLNGSFKDMAKEGMKLTWYQTRPAVVISF